MMQASNMIPKQLFFHDLKKYNATNFRNIEKADLTKDDPVIHKAFSSVVTRYFIFKERHPEISETQMRILYFQLKIDLISKFFSEYPDTNRDQLVAFQVELRNYAKETRGGEVDADAIEIQDKQPSAAT